MVLSASLGIARYLVLGHTTLDQVMLHQLADASTRAKPATAGDYDRGNRLAR